MTTHLREQLRDADPLAREPGLSAGDVQTMRGVVLSKAQSSSPDKHRATRLVLAAAAGFVAILALFMSKGGDPVTRTVQEPPKTVDLQVQFQTPNGTRIIWVLNSNFPL